jgi:hypothetical protein
VYASFDWVLEGSNVYVTGTFMAFTSMDTDIDCEEWRIDGEIANWGVSGGTSEVPGPGRRKSRRVPRSIRAHILG